jgi:cephalosporin hydroxylase
LKAPPRSVVVLLTALCVGLAGLNVYQWGRLKQATAPPSNAEVMRLFYEEWMPLNKPTFWQNKWSGLPTLQNPMDVWITQEILHEVRPDFVIEAGAFHGGSAALFATILEQISPQGRVISIDIEDRMQEARKLPIVQRKVDFLLGSSVDSRIVDEVKRRVQGGKVLVILDSLHTKEHVLAELNAYAPIVSVGSYLIVQDTCVNGHPTMPDYGEGPWEAVQAFMAVPNNYVIDKSRERLMFTFSPDGWLKRVR